MRRLKTLLLGMALGTLAGGLTVGCKKSLPSGTASPYDEGGSGGSYDYDAAGDAMPTAAMPSDEGARERDVSKRMDDSPYREEPPAPPVIAAPGGSTSTPTARPATDTTEEPRKDFGGRLIIYTAGMRIAVFNLERALEKAEALPEKYGGYVFSMSGGDIVLKIPARKLRAAMAELAAFGTVEAKSLSSQDVSAEYTDIESRIRALEATHKQLLDLLAKARTVDEALNVRRALDEVAAELEVLKGRMRQLDSLIAFSTLTLSMYERGPHTPIPSSNDPFPWVDSLGVEATEWN
jgi:hypothetical protein